MAGENFKLSIFCTLLLISCVPCSKLNVPRVLLPIFSDFSTKFTLEAIEGGCYKWTTTRSDIIKITLIDENKDFQCSSKIEVSSITKEDARNLAVVLAQDVHTDQILKCDVIVDVINSLSVTTTTRELFMDEVPEAFQLNAYDLQGNEFSTLENVEFDWNIVSTGNKDAEVLRYLPFRDSPYEAQAHIKTLEENNKKGSIILLEGVKTGTAKVSVKLPYSYYKHVPTVEVILSVIANLLLTPGEIYMMVGDTALFKLFYMNSGRMDEIRLPDQQYYIEAENDIIQVDKKTNEVSAVKLGKTHVLVQNSYAKKNDPAIKLPSAVVNVVDPAYMIINLQPIKNWAILIGDQHEITIDVFSSTDHKLHLGPGVPIHVQIADAFFVEQRSQNGSWVTGWGIRESRAQVQASLDAVIHPTRGKINLPKAIQAEAEILIYPRISINPSEVILPWDPQVKPKYTVELIAKGGDGRFLWTSTDHSIGLVTQTGVVRTLNKGFFEISAAMMRNHHNRQIVKFSIYPPVRLEIIEYIMDAEVGEPVHLHIALYAEKLDGENVTYVPVTQCQNLPFQLKTSDNKFVFNKSEVIPPVGVSCGNLALVAQEVGTTKVTVVYYQDGVDLEDSVTITAHNPLKLLQPQRPVVLSVGSTANLLFVGGPRPQIGRQSDHQRTAVSENDDIIQAEDVTERHELPMEDGTAVWVLCKKLGETSVILTISNTPSLPNCKSHGSKIITKVICGKPRDIQIEPQIKVGNASACPMDLSSDRIVVPSRQPIDLYVIIHDDMGRVFSNATSLSLTWESKPAKTTKFKSIDGTIVKTEKIGTIELINATLQTVTPNEDKGLIEITATVMGYNKKILNHFKITPEWPEFLDENERETVIEPIATTIGLYLVDNTEVSQNTTIIFNQPNAKTTINVLHGSGYVELALNVENIVDVNYIEGTRQLEITPLNSGNVVVQVADLCVASVPNYIHVRVVSVSRIDVEMLHKVQINHCIDVIVKLYDETDQLLNVTEIEDLNLRHRFSENIANLALLEQEKGPFGLGELHYVLSGVEVGDTILTFSYESTPMQILSSPMELQVFAPLKLNPRNVTLLMGATLQLTVKGGPQPDANIEFTSHSSITECSDTGIVVGKSLGLTKITAKAVSVHAVTGEKIIYTQDTVEVNVIKLTGVKIAAPLTKFKVGAKIPFWATGIPDSLTPIVLATFEDNSLQFDWEVADNYLATQSSLFAAFGISYTASDRAITRLTGLQPGKTRLNLNVTVGGNKKQVFTAFVEIEVFEALELRNPWGLPGRSLLMSRHARLQLETNLDTSYIIEYSMPEGNTSLVTVDEKGLLQSYSNTGFAMLIISATDDIGLVQTLTYVVEVKPIHFMMISVVSNWRIHLDSSLRVIPLGSDFDLVPQFYDNIGNRFNAGPIKVKATTNRLDLIKIKHSSSNATLKISTRKAGHTVVKAWTDGKDNTADYIRIHAEEVVKPVVESLTTGDMICLYSPVVTKHLQIGHWESSDPASLLITARDVGFVIGRTETTVSLTHALHANVPLRLKILPVSEISIVPESAIITNGPEGSINHVGVVFKNMISPKEKRTNLIQGWQCDRSFMTEETPTPYNCKIAFSNDCVGLDPFSLFTLESVFKPDIGQYQCLLISTGSNMSDASTIDTNVTVWVEYEAESDLSQRLELPFIPSVYADPEVLIGEQSSGDFEIKGLEYVLKQIDVQPADSSIVYIDKGKFIDKTRMKFTAQLIDYHRKLANSEESMGIIISSPITGQILKIMVTVTNDFTDDTCSAWRSPLYRFIQSYKHSLTIVISMVIIFVITCYVYASYMQPVVNVNVHPNRSLLAAGTSVMPPSAMSVNQQRNFVPTSTPIRQCLNCSRQFPASPICNRNNCTCSRSGGPVYGDVSSCNTSPEIRRNRRFL